MKLTIYIILRNGYLKTKYTIIQKKKCKILELIKAKLEIMSTWNYHLEKIISLCTHRRISRKFWVIYPRPLHGLQDRWALRDLLHSRETSKKKCSNLNKQIYWEMIGIYGIYNHHDTSIIEDKLSFFITLENFKDSCVNNLIFTN